jgi:hypothetical protein
MPITLNGDTGIQTPMYNGTITANAVTPSVNMKNRIINGAMVIDQRNAGASVTVDDAAPYTLDRWQAVDSSDGAFTVQQDAGAVTPPAGFKDYLGVTITTADSSLAAGQFSNLLYKIEGNNVYDFAWGTANAKTVTLSFWVRSSLTGTFAGSIRNDAGARSYVFNYTISAANTWEYKTVTIAGDTTGTWETGTSTGLLLTWSLGAGTNFNGTVGSWSAGSFFSSSGSVSVIGTSGATFYITGVQLEVGSTATSFDYRPYGTELVLCQRYFYKMNGLVNQDMLVGAAADQTTWIRYSFALPVIMRTTPSLVSTAASTYSNLTGSGGQAGSAIALDNSSATNVTLNLNSGGITAGSAATFRIGSSPTGYVAFSSEL